MYRIGFICLHSILLLDINVTLLMNVFVADGMWSGKRFGDEEVGLVWDFGQRGNIPQSPGGTASGENTHTHKYILPISLYSRILLMFGQLIRQVEHFQVFPSVFFYINLQLCYDKSFTCFNLLPQMHLQMKINMLTIWILYWLLDFDVQYTNDNNQSYK